MNELKHKQKRTIRIHSNKIRKSVEDNFTDHTRQCIKLTEGNAFRDQN